MRMTEREDGSIDVYLRQSWINDAVKCAERGRQAMLRPDWSLPNELTLMGTAVHAGIEANLARQEDTSSVARATFMSLIETERMRWVRKDSTPESCAATVTDLARMWERDIRPHVDKPVKIEEYFTFHLDDMVINDRVIRVHGVGTADLITESDLWDWKTAGKKYSQAQYQSEAIQPTMYAAAAVAQGLLSWPVTFNYGVMVRGGKTAQIVPVHRTEDHVEWLRQMIRPHLRTALILGTEEPWHRVDTHFLCNETWCPWWSVCKGAVLAPSDIKPMEAVK